MIVMIIKDKVYYQHKEILLHLIRIISVLVQIYSMIMKKIKIKKIKKNIIRKIIKIILQEIPIGITKNKWTQAILISEKSRNRIIGKCKLKKIMHITTKNKSKMKRLIKNNQKLNLN